ncbi:hypothetical protein M408DRAFT_332032 [Serendipita vermifera MAFF 305830]|uniref:Arrestin-like N-terminal domain-containing protein n=1 Tax=Serendipita vermifera MAFF 305830 TaxID=933852 RepID=A0A0C2X3L3_SERVB|nr:hypothetical protein M408DRAFT_332032 [Serendipita vermifera MAFF 305830]
MPINVEIIPSDNVLQMYGPQETDCAYSLSGQILLSTTPSRGAFNKETRSQPALLTSLVLTFEGSVEHFAKGQGYNAKRLCSVSQTLVVRAQPVAIPSTPDHKVAVVFDLAVPGWLPASLSSKHATTAVTRYALYAKAVYQSEEPSGLWLGSKTKYRDATPVPITLRRNRTTAPPKKCTFAVPTRAISTSSRIPQDVISAIKARATIPSYVLQNASEPFDLRLDVGASVSGVTVHKFGVRVIQSSTYGTTPDQAFLRTFPLPAEQPPTVPLLAAHELDSLYMAGIAFPANALRIDKDDVLHPDHPSVFNMQEGSQGHALETELSSITVPLHLDTALVKPTYASPYLHIAHRLLVDLDIAYNGHRERVGFHLPLPLYDGPLRSSSGAQAGLPAYVQLYHSNGEAKYVAGLPAYSKECRPGEIKDEAGASHPVEFRRRHVRARSDCTDSDSSSSESESSC